MMRPPRRHRVGALRPSQMLYSFGVGSIVDLPNISVMVMGLDDWPVAHLAEIGEERLLATVRVRLGQQVERLCAPPLADTSDGDLPDPLDESALIGVPVVPFPRWMRCPRCDLLARLDSGLFELKADPYHPDRTRYVHRNCKCARKPPPVVPARFLVACRYGHVDDFPWHEFVHGDSTDCPSVPRLREYGVSGEAGDVEIRCGVCNAARRMSDAFGEDAAEILPACRGRRAHLRDFADRECPEPLKAILLGASNLWFPVTLSALSVPTACSKLAQLVDQHWVFLEKAVSPEILAAFRQIGQLRAFANYSNEEIWEAMEARRAATAGTVDAEAADLKKPEWLAFSQPDPARNTSDFKLTPVETPPGYERLVCRVILVERLREVGALLGFTRIESPGDFGEVGVIPPDQQALLARGAPRWVPAAEVRGEGIFLEVHAEEVQRWCERDSVRVREDELREAHRQWRRIRTLQPEAAGFPGIRYVLLHTLAHALMRQFVLECGYTAASIRERVYSREPHESGGPMAGILIYTAAPDAEGTLGGLVSLGEPRALARHLDQALGAMRLCASDPLCAEHHPYSEGVTLHGAACHACLFAPETSCERGNKYLDRTLLVRTIGRCPGAFFESQEYSP